MIQIQIQIRIQIVIRVRHRPWRTRQTRLARRIEAWLPRTKVLFLYLCGQDGQQVIAVLEHGRSHLRGKLGQGSG